MNYHEDLKAFVDGELSPARTEDIRQAIARDPALAAEVEEMRSLSAVFRAVPQPEPHGLDDTLRALRLAEPKAARRSPWAWWLGISLAGAGGLVMMLTSLDNPGAASDSAGFASASREAASPMAGDSAKENAKRYVAKAESQERDLSLRNETTNKAVTVPAPPTVQRIRGKVEQKQTGRKAVEKAEAVTPEPSLPEVLPSVKDEVPVASIAPAEPEVELKVPSLEEGRAELLAFATENKSKLVESEDKETKTLVLEVPEDQLEAVLAKLKLLPKMMAEKRKRAQFAAPAAAGPGGPGGGGFGGAVGGAGAAPVAAETKAQSDAKGVAPTPKKPERKIKIILIVPKPAVPKKDDEANSGSPLAVSL